MAYIEGEGRTQATLFPVVLDDLIPAEHMCRVIDAFIGRLDMDQLGFERAQAANTGRPGYDPRDLLSLYLYGYLNQIRSSRRLETECRRNVELMWLLGRLYPDHKSIAEFRRLHRDAIVAAGAELVRFARGCGLIRGEWIAIDGSKFRAVASIDATREKIELRRYLDSIEKADEDQQTNVDQSAVAAALEKLKQHPEPDAGFMLVRQMALPAYNVQTAVDAEHAIIVAHTSDAELQRDKGVVVAELLGILSLSAQAYEQLKTGTARDTVKTLSRLQRYCSNNGFDKYLVPICGFKTSWDIWRTVERHFLASTDYILLEQKTTGLLQAGLTIDRMIAEAKEVAKQFLGITGTPLTPEHVMGLLFSLAAQSEAITGVNAGAA